ncbi:MAG: septum formation protein Maf [Verrucomicrobia bacterium]|nr:septum formation protein Maf [Verrucomicrobiota bacterium]
MKQPRVLLASASPERRRILERLGLAFDVMATGVAEDNDAALAPRELVVRHANAKADAALAMSPGHGVVIACDTVAECAGKVLGSPRTDDEARAMLRELAGRTHAIVSGLVVAMGNGRRATRVVETGVMFRAYDDATIDAYVRTGEPLHKAGAYGIQGLGALLVERVAGSHTNVQGLPVEALADCLAELGYDLMALVAPGTLQIERP